MSKLSLSRDGEALYVNDAAGVSVFKGTILGGSGTKVAIKEQIHSTLASANNAIQESMNMARLLHPSICRIFDCFLEEVPRAGFKSTIIVELMAADLNKRIDARKRTGYWREEELMGILVQLVSGLSFAQSLGISHRDIKPQNVFVNEDESVVKVGDFGSASINIDGLGLKSTLVGSPLFLSPILKRQLLSKTTPGPFSPATDLRYDPYRSDVYSLGVTFAYMSTLVPPMGLVNIDNLDVETEAVLRMVGNYQTFQWFLRYMLSPREEDRPDFVTLESWLKQYWVPPALAVQPAAEPVPEQAYQREWEYNGGQQPQGGYMNRYSQYQGEAQRYGGEQPVAEGSYPSSGQMISVQPVYGIQGGQGGYLPQGGNAPAYSLPPSAGPVQYEESKAVPSGAAAWGNVKQCEGCRTSFTSSNREAKYCGLDCERKTTAARPMPAVVATEPKCSECKYPIKNPMKATDLPPDLTDMRNEAGKYCSMQCIKLASEKKSSGVVADPCDIGACVRCAKPISDVRGARNPPVKMRCGHFFHNNECLFLHLQELSDAFRNRFEISCPKCPGQHEDYNGFLPLAFVTRKAFELKKDEVRKKYCVVCKKTNGVEPYYCGHGFCPKHMVTSRYCGFCEDMERYYT